MRNPENSAGLWGLRWTICIRWKNLSCWRVSYKRGEQRAQFNFQKAHWLITSISVLYSDEWWVILWILVIRWELKLTAFSPFSILCLRILTVKQAQLSWSPWKLVLFLSVSLTVDQSIVLHCVLSSTWKDLLHVRLSLRLLVKTLVDKIGNILAWNL